ncbi:polysaccharide export protein [Mucilaginibacter paludis DSM 18603]|uniref:Polysaccharide export protein n=2 Tax=Mucilaginibacter TaxID=423349 RepID=H1Y0I0_9SPHI|nr:polysaccharide export protein [Mucilaginibacter paludis DSM 18603]
MHKYQLEKSFLVALFVSFCFTSCYTTKKSVYFTDLVDSASKRNINTAVFKEPLIQTDDILSITVQTTDPTVTATLNQANANTASGSSGQTAVTGYLVNKNGEVQIPIIGNVKVAGLTTLQASELITNKSLHDFKFPSVQVRFANYKVNVLGEVNRPGSYILPNEKVSVIDAISLAGDLTIYGKRENVLVIREHDGHKEYARLNLGSSEIFKSPYYYLTQNDLIYVEASKAKISTANDADTFRNISIGIAIITLISILIRTK